MCGIEGLSLKFLKFQPVTIMWYSVCHLKPAQTNTFLHMHTDPISSPNTPKHTITKPIQCRAASWLQCISPLFSKFYFLWEEIPIPCHLGTFGLTNFYCIFELFQATFMNFFLKLRLCAAVRSHKRLYSDIAQSINPYLKTAQSTCAVRQTLIQKYFLGEYFVCVKQDIYCVRSHHCAVVGHHT